ncbi:MAG TPA: glutamate-5-semialdehyde dehydrogenase [Aminobacterium sp.]|jgi:glutamate-5-semialdehyde dehydrogenase|uniref:glutamate-5-semialdehyde dehydrogenase n=1 Tax=Aminobacterium TaxID=81466 RepID=UPI000EBD77E8|nr:glutamate-5-semialdehyde dehydrogenase [Aminobacterium sp. UBA4834]HCA41094.1 glutamate-5-semialdehyde dehydrogenase [Aminobacterium sp.]
MEIKDTLLEMGRVARCAARFLATATGDQKNRALFLMAQALRDHKKEILLANHKDIEAGREAGLTSALIERLTLNEKRVEAMALGLEEIAALRDPVGEVLGMWTAEKGLRVGRVRVPLGVIGIIYESRPNVTADAAGLCLKAGNAVILRGGKEALHSNIAIASILSQAAFSAGIPQGAISLIESPDRQATTMLMKMNEYVDVLIPRGGKGLKLAVLENATVPFIMTGMGNCHIFVDETANIEKAIPIVVNAKVQRPSVCNAMETMLVHKNIAPLFIPQALTALREQGVEIRGDKAVCRLYSQAVSATEKDWSTEYLDLILAVKIVDNIEEAMNHIANYGTGHSEAILTESYTNAQAFLNGIDAAAVYVNASTRFTDGGVFGFGAEMGISTQKLHARGPMGVEQLTSTKFIIYGNGQVRE